MEGIIGYIGIGSNLGDSLKNCRHGAEMLSRIKGIELETVSSFYRTEPVGMENQNYFINAVAEIKTVLGANDLLLALQNIENDIGRKRGVKGGPRVIDLDILFYGQNVIDREDLKVPHPELHKRRFVLEPLCEIASYFIHPSFGVSVQGLNDRLDDRKIVEKVE